MISVRIAQWELIKSRIAKDFKEVGKDARPILGYISDLQSELDTYESVNLKMMTALQFYADEFNYGSEIPQSPVDVDSGSKAREVIR